MARENPAHTEVRMLRSAGGRFLGGENRAEECAWGDDSRSLGRVRMRSAPRGTSHGKSQRGWIVVRMVGTEMVSRARIPHDAGGVRIVVLMVMAGV